MSAPFPAPDTAVASTRGTGRETDSVNALPPPLPPPDQPARVSAATSGGSESDWDWDRVKELVEEWYRPVLRREGWVALAYIFVGAITGSLFFGLFIAASAVTFGLCFVLVGFLLIVPVLRLPGAFVKIDRDLAGWLGVTIERRPLRPVTGIGPAAIKAALTDVERWRLIGFLAVNSVVAPVFFSIASIPIGFAFQGVFGGGVLSDVPVLFGLGTPVTVLGGVFMIGAIPRLSLWLADLKVQSTRWFIGPDRLAAAEQRVSSLSTQRQDILDAVAEERRRIERNLHDGVQQQLVAIGLDLGMATNHLETDTARARELIVQARKRYRARSANSDNSAAGCTRRFWRIVGSTRRCRRWWRVHRFPSRYTSTPNSRCRPTSLRRSTSSPTRRSRTC